ncbi:hypothetical protein POJ06DRAFT_240628 [Lipomyces tetrasporus]|uniref:HAD-like protein n=1 Tax=Lipomyces tetrasporus TaxID=54092 RepID=A0AAD7VQ85_9ASCO|nr:uncharacterized protein POJ06DRAFT_240628 [Lipomyces tetrasporus]KAJ8097299.1 hypothetical protein POJ06DRAFT_240628 [Lipomyces tetrasporus]
MPPRLVLPTPRLLTLDAFSTIYSPRPPVPDQYSQIYAQHFPTHEPIPPQLLSISFRKAFKARAQSHPNYLGGEKEWWTDVIRTTFTIAAADAFTASSAEQVSGLAREVFVNDLYEHFNSARAYMLMPDVTDFLDSIHRVPTRVGILSNSDSRCRSVLRGLGVLASEETTAGLEPGAGDLDGRTGHAWITRDQDVVLSSEVGVEKPDARIFEAALANILGDSGYTEPESPEDDPLAVANSVWYWHVGDDLQKDVLPIVDALNSLKLRCWGAVYLKRQGDDCVSNPGGEVRLTHGGRVIEATDLRDIIGLWTDGVEVVVE